MPRTGGSRIFHYNSGMAGRGLLKSGLRWALALFMVAAGINHFVKPAVYMAMMPEALPAPALLVIVSGVFEILGGLGLLVPATRRWAAWGLVALLIAVFPANLNMAMHQLPLGSYQPPGWALWARLPLQGVLIAWAWWYTRPSAASAASAAAPRA
jgi:uncharacterized membrane protein